MSFENNKNKKLQDQKIRSHFMTGFISANGDSAETRFYSHDRGGDLQKETDLLTTNIKLDGEERPFEKNPFAHDPLHVLVQAKLSSLGVKEVRVTSVENEIMVNALARISKQFNKRYGGSAQEILSSFMVGCITQAYPDAKQNPNKYEEYAGQLFKLYMQSIALGKLILKHESFFDREQDKVKNFFLSNVKEIQNTFNDPEQDLHQDRDTLVYVEASSSQPEPELLALYKDTVTIINSCLDKIAEIKKQKHITP